MNVVWWPNVCGLNVARAALARLLMRCHKLNSAASPATLVPTRNIALCLSIQIVQSRHSNLFTSFMLTQCPVHTDEAAGASFSKCGVHCTLDSAVECLSVPVVHDRLLHTLHTANCSLPQNTKMPLYHTGPVYNCNSVHRPPRNIQLTLFNTLPPPLST